MAQITRQGLIGIARSLYGSFAGKIPAVDEFFGEAVLSLIDDTGKGILSPITQVGLFSIIDDEGTGVLSTVDDNGTGIESEIT